MSATHSVQSVQDTQLGLTQGELQLLRQQRQVMTQRSHQDSSRPADRGRGTSRHSQPSSRAASAASSQPGNRIFLDPQYLRALQNHLDNLLHRIGQEIERLEDLTENSVNSNSDRHRRTETSADDEIKRLKMIVAKIDALEIEQQKTESIKKAVKRLRQRVDEMDDRVERSSSSRHDDRHKDRHGDRPSDSRQSSSRHAELVHRPRPTTTSDRHR